MSAVPTDAMWGGDLSNLVDDNGNLTRIYDPLTTDANGIRQPFPGQPHSRQQNQQYAEGASTADRKADKQYQSVCGQ